MSKIALMRRGDARNAIARDEVYDRVASVLQAKSERYSRAAQSVKDRKHFPLLQHSDLDMRYSPARNVLSSDLYGRDFEYCRKGCGWNHYTYLDLGTRQTTTASNFEHAMGKYIAQIREYEHKIQDALDQDHAKSGQQLFEAWKHWKYDVLQECKSDAEALERAIQHERDMATSQSACLPWLAKKREYAQELLREHHATPYGWAFERKAPEAKGSLLDRIRSAFGQQAHDPEHAYTAALRDMDDRQYSNVFGRLGCLRIRNDDGIQRLLASPLQDRF